MPWVPSLVTVIRSKLSTLAISLAMGSEVWGSPSVLITMPFGYAPRDLTTGTFSTGLSVRYVQTLGPTALIVPS
jgi:hypothetical protein